MDVAPQYETFSYQRRVPEQTLLYRVLAGNLETFLDRCRTEEHELPRYVEFTRSFWTACTGMLKASRHSTPRLRRPTTMCGPLSKPRPIA